MAQVNLIHSVVVSLDDFTDEFLCLSRGVEEKGMAEIGHAESYGGLLEAELHPVIFGEIDSLAVGDYLHVVGVYLTS